MSNLLRELAEVIDAARALPPPTGTLEPTGNLLMQADNLVAMNRLAPGTIDLIYIDPPFASDADYPARVPIGDLTVAMPAYADRWPEGMIGYLRFLVPRLALMRHLLRERGNLCVHVDQKSSHYVKIALDAIFGESCFVNELIWRYGKMSNTARRFPRNHDTLLVYSRTASGYFRPVRAARSEYRVRYQRHLDGNVLRYGAVQDSTDKLILRRIAREMKRIGRPLTADDVLFDFDTEFKTQDDVFTDISIIKGNAREARGYATQKPEKLLTRVIEALCPPDGTVADFFAGAGTTATVADRLGRRWIAVDPGPMAIVTTLRRLHAANADVEFWRDPDLPVSTFYLDADGEIANPRLEELPLTPADRARVAAAIAADPGILIAVRRGDVVMDVFGRIGTKPV